MSLSITNRQGYVSGNSALKVYDYKGRLKTIGGGSPPPPAPVVWGSITGLVTNQTDLITYLSGNYYPLSSNPAGYLTQTAANLLYYPLSSNPAGYITSAALAGYVPTSRTLTINGTTYDLSADRSWTIAAGGTVTSVELAAGTGISLSGTNPITTSGTITVTNSAPDQVVSLATTGTGLAVTGTYPSFTLENTLPDQTVVLTAGTGIGITGTYPSFTIGNTGLTSVPDLQQVVNAGNGITNFGGTGNASIQSTNFTNNRTLYLNDNAYPTIRLVDNLNAANNLQIDVDTLTVDGVSYNWSSIVNPPTGALVALPFTADHITATGNPYLIGDVVWYSGNVYICIANNDSILPTNASYWTSLGAGNPLVQQPGDWNSTSGNNQILNKPTIPAQYNPTAGTGISITGAYPNQTISNTLPDQTVVLTGGTAISITGTYPNFGIANTAPDQVVSLSTTGTGLAVTGTYPSFTLQNTLPDQTVVLNNGSGISITGTYPNFTIAATGTPSGDSLSPLLLMGG